MMAAVTLLVVSDASPAASNVSLIFAVHVKVKVKADIALPGENPTPPQNYGTLLAICDHTVLPATRHK